MSLDNDATPNHDGSIFEQAYRDHETLGISLSEMIVTFLESENCLICREKGMLLMALDTGRSWHIHYAINRTGKNVLAVFLEKMPYYREEVSWCRPLKPGVKDIKVFSTDKLFRHAGLAPPPWFYHGRKVDFASRWGKDDGVSADGTGTETVSASGGCVPFGGNQPT